MARTSSNSGLFLGVACQQRLIRSAISCSTCLSWSLGRSFEVTLCGTSVCEMPAACLGRHREFQKKNALEIVSAKTITQTRKSRGVLCEQTRKSKRPTGEIGRGETSDDSQKELREEIGGMVTRGAAVR